MALDSTGHTAIDDGDTGIVVEVVVAGTDVDAAVGGVVVVDSVPTSLSLPPHAEAAIATTARSSADDRRCMGVMVPV